MKPARFAPNLIWLCHRRMACAFGVICVAFTTLTSPAWSASTISEPDLLDAEKAFALSSRLIDDNTLELRYAIADGYYMYRDRFKIWIGGQPVSIPEHLWPAGKWKQDVTFGKVVVYRGSVRLLLAAPLTDGVVPQADKDSYRLRVLSQGCADAGVCYPPLDQSIELVRGKSAWFQPRLEGNEPKFRHGPQTGTEFINQSPRDK